MGLQDGKKKLPTTAVIKGTVYSIYFNYTITITTIVTNILWNTYLKMSGVFMF